MTRFPFCEEGFSMKPTRHTNLLLLVAFLTACVWAQATFLGEKELVVAIGESASSAVATTDHNMSMASLEDGQLNFKIKAGGKAYKITLTEEQVDDILDGTTVHATTSEGGMTVQITLKSKKPKPSGW
jgi:uncharacterized cupredoxin-like copper-binding protein